METETLDETKSLKEMEKNLRKVEKTIMKNGFERDLMSKKR